METKTGWRFMNVGKRSYAVNGEKIVDLGRYSKLARKRFRRLAKISLIMWWFVAVNYGARVVGPFASLEQCDYIRSQVRTIGTPTTACWNDGK